MRFEELFLLGGTLRRRALHLDLAEPMTSSDAIAYFEGTRRPPRPARFTVQSGSWHGDWVDTTLTPLYVVSLRLLEILTQSSFTGWSRYPVRITGRDGNPIEGYEGITVTGRCGPPDDTRAQETIRPPISPSGNAYAVRVGLYFEESSWDGSDIFRPEGTGFVICTAAVRRCLMRAKMKNLRFKPLTEFEMLI